MDFANVSNYARMASTQAKSRHSLRTAFLIYGTMVSACSDSLSFVPGIQSPTELRAAARPIQTAAKAVRYEAVIANWNRYRTKDARAEAR